MNPVLYALGPVICGCLLDLAFGDPVWRGHPIRLMGALAAWLEKRLLKPETASREQRAAGRLFTVICVGIVLIISVGLLAVAWRIHMWAGFAVESLLCWTLLAARCLRDESMRVYGDLRRGDLAAARESLSWIVGRDTRELDEAGVVRAAVETVAENTSDGVIAPLFHIALGGAALGAAYKMVNTLDSMVGYKNERYLHFGRASARLDDVVGWLPARISSVCMILASGLCGLNLMAAVRVWRRDRRAHASPNSAQTEAVCAGALGLMLAGDASYGGVTVSKPTIGDDLRTPETEDIRRANRLMFMTGAVAVVPFCALRLGLVLILKYLCDVWFG